MTENTERPLRRREAAAFLKEQGYPIEPATLAKYATVGGGPLYEVFGRKALYRPNNLLDWAKARSTGLRRSTSEAANAVAA